MVTSAQLEELLSKQAAQLEELQKLMEASERSKKALEEKVSSMSSELEQLIGQTKQLDVRDTFPSGARPFNPLPSSSTTRLPSHRRSMPQTFPP